MNIFFLNIGVSRKIPYLNRKLKKEMGFVNIDT